MSWACVPAGRFFSLLLIFSILMCNVLNTFPATFSSFVYLVFVCSLSLSAEKVHLGSKPLARGYHSCDGCCSHIFCVTRKKGTEDVRICDGAQDEEGKRSSLVQPRPADSSLRLSRPTVAPVEENHGHLCISLSLARGLKEFCQPTPGVGPQFFSF